MYANGLQEMCSINFIRCYYLSSKNWRSDHSNLAITHKLESITGFINYVD